MKECRVTKRVGNDDSKSHEIEKERMIIVGRKVDSVRRIERKRIETCQWLSMLPVYKKIHTTPSCDLIRVPIWQIF